MPEVPNFLLITAFIIVLIFYSGRPLKAGAIARQDLALLVLSKRLAFNG